MSVSTYLVLILTLIDSTAADCTVERCEWEQWEMWTGCSKSCGGGTKHRSRAFCCRADLDIEACMRDCGMDYWSHVNDFDEYSMCNTYCYNGAFVNQGYSRGYCQCSIYYEGYCCEKLKPTSYMPDGGGSHCSTVCEWSGWQQWSSCTVSCGGNGTKTRRRNLCCLDEYWNYQGCTQNCRKDETGNVQTSSCGDTCEYGGTLKPGGFGCDCCNRSFGHCCENLLQDCLPYPTDVIFILDSSVSQTKEQFKVQLDFVSRFVSLVNVSAEEFQFAVITFSTNAQVEINFNKSVDAETLQQRIMNIIFRPGATFTNKGLLAAADVARKSERRQGIVSLTYAFVLTDGMSNDKRETRIAADKLKQAKVNVIAIGIGHEVSHQELVDIASRGNSLSPSSSRSDSYVFSVGDFNALDTLLKQLVQVTCKKCSEVSHLSDVVLLIDESVMMSNEEFQLSMDIIESVIQDTKTIGETNGTKFGLLHLGNDLKVKIQLEEDQTEKSLLFDLQTTKKRQEFDYCENARECNAKNITLAIMKIAESILNETGRENARKFLVVLSSGRFNDIPKIKEEMAIFQNKTDVRAFVIGPGIDVKMEGLLSLATEANHVYAVLDKNDKAKLRVMQSEFSYTDCSLK